MFLNAKVEVKLSAILTCVVTLYNVCSVHWRMFSTSGDIMMHVRGYQEYIRGCSVHRGIP